jgi:type II secretory pathway predicted ATPase ExeA
MYLDFFGLREQPFGVTPDPAFLYLSQTHREALEALRSDLVNDRGFMALVGEPGLGKTMLLYKLLDEWNPTCRIVFLFQTQCDSREFFRYLLAELGIDAESMGLVAMHHALNQILFHEMLDGKRFVLIVDEAQNLDHSVLETVRGLSNFETDHAKLLNIVLAGQSQLADKLAAPELRQLRQRIGILNRLRPLDSPETAEYINHRLALAGHRGDSIFSPDALQAISHASQGAPRNINQICHHALCTAATKGLRSVNLEIAQDTIARLHGQSIELAPLSAPARTEAPAGVRVPVSTPASHSTPSAASSVRPAPRPAMVLTYGSPRKSNLKLGGPAAIVACVLLFVGVAYALPSVRRFATQEYNNTSSSISGGAADAGAAPRQDFSSPSEITLAANDPDPQDSPSSQVITVSPKAGQTIEELSLLYAGHFDPQFYQQIRALNPDVNNFDNLEAGQLIRLPLPPGTLRKVLDTANPSEAAEPGKWQLAVAKIKGLFSNTKH